MGTGYKQYVLYSLIVFILLESKKEKMIERENIISSSAEYITDPLIVLLARLNSKG